MLLAYQGFERGVATFYDLPGIPCAGGGAMIYFLIGAAGLHVLFMGAELFPWRLPALLRIASKGLPKGEPFTCAQQTLVATIVHNAGIYNGILAGGLFWAAFRGDPAIEVARVMLSGALALPSHF
jgi:hypothetical protein